MQKVVTVVRSTLSDLKLAIDGTIIMSENLRDALDSMYDARIPATWKRASRIFLQKKIKGKGNQPLDKSVGARADHVV